MWISIFLLFIHQVIKTNLLRLWIWFSFLILKIEYWFYIKKLFWTVFCWTEIQLNSGDKSEKSDFDVNLVPNAGKQFLKYNDLQ